MDVLTKIRSLQGERDWTDYKFAQEANIPLATLSSVFARNTTPKIETLQCICNAFGLTLAQFFLEDEKKEVLSETEKENRNNVYIPLYDYLSIPVYIHQSPLNLVLLQNIRVYNSC